MNSQRARRRRRLKPKPGCGISMTSVSTPSIVIALVPSSWQMRLPCSRSPAEKPSFLIRFGMHVKPQPRRVWRAQIAGIALPDINW